ncbi:hypothetical protein ASPWEDRAFT_195148 [Aspergillus wentii DTO 134E9]|uniref:Ribosome maturation protein SDO1/SBDS N-terminal domain-containing protein n=1 Tax=Aspergillus wentii DTO 134E9 TaxID=1073089 RepID=A0A1L9RZE8_ASPWE|nr:uncharacterized protein ASPWEDRAFT_195148 [Aspergillus wentii DTO 134E9]KAI9932670.1 hypothetical protein MW887_008919 [Aspergillus wentii]OJJ40244.1 hypothetical protein ASPWEDRAFT_195148 [Aspergillus wentii DTO 134E9]
MTRGNATNSKVFYKGNSEDFIVFVDDPQILESWRKDRSIALAHVVNGWKIFVTHKHGTQGILDGASKGLLETEFGTSDEDEIMKQILEKGEYQASTAREHNGDRDTRKGPTGVTR